MENELVIGRHAVLELLQTAREINKIFVQDSMNKSALGKIFFLANERKIVVQSVAKKKLDYLTDGRNHQGVAAQVSAYKYVDVEDILEKAKSLMEEPFVLLLDEISDPRNLGAILRSADAVGVHGVIISKRRAVGLTATVAKVATGAIEHVMVARVTNMAQTIEGLKKSGLWIVGTDADNKQDYRCLDGKLPLAVIIGSERKGISRILKEKCDFLLQIPMVGHVTSLNASVAASLLMYEVYRKRFPE